MSILDRYLLRRTLPPMGAVLITTMVAFLMERLLRSFYLLSETNRGFHFLVELTVDLTPHYIGLTLPVGFFIALFVVVSRLNNGSEVDAILAGGVSLGRMAAPLVALGLALSLFSLLLYGFVQPYSRYAYHAVLHAAANAGWSGEVKPQAVLTPGGGMVLTADQADSTGQRLERVFIRKRTAGGREEVLTARSAALHRSADNANLVLDLQNGQLFRGGSNGGGQVLTFNTFTLELPLVPEAQLLRPRGVGEENELTLFELAQQAFGAREPGLPRAVLAAELYARLARALTLPLLPLLAIPLGLTAKRAGSAPAIGVAGVLLFAFQTSLAFGHGLVAGGRITPVIAVGAPTFLFSAACIGTFLASRNRPGENPVNWLAEQMGDLITRITRLWRPRAAAG